MRWKQERPEWCPHKDCQFLRQSQGNMCGGKLLLPQTHPPITNVPCNTNRFCMNADGDVIDFQVHHEDLEGLRWIFDAIDGKKTSWRSKREGSMAKFDEEWTKARGK